MAGNNAPPSIDPADIGTLTGAFREILKKHLQGIDDMLPGQVVAFDREKNLVQVQPLIMKKSTIGDNIVRAQIASIPVFQIGGGGFMLNFNLKPGDLGWIKANDRDISLFMQTFQQAPINTYRLHSFQDAVFIPSVMKGYVINSEDEENAVLQTLDGSVRVAIWSDRVKITAPLVVVDAPNAHFTGDVLVDGKTDIGHGLTWGNTAPSAAVGQGAIHTTGLIESDTDVKVGTITLNTHKHTGVTSGGSDTGGPTA